ncbi:MAG: SWIM zinc finger family protein, partial [Bacteroidetes bacterium]
MALSKEQILALAPDDASAKAGAALARKDQWVELGFSPEALWGLCKGSGQNPYQTQIDRSDLAAKCSCPSRKFPCKHSIGLMLLYSASPAAFSQKPVPDWVTGWLNKRKEAPKNPSGEAVAKQKTPDAAAKRAD